MLPLPKPRQNMSIPTPKPKKVRVTDQNGTIIPENLLTIWEGREAVADVAQSLSSILKKLILAEDSKSPSFAGLNFNSVLMHLENALEQVKGAVPHCVCPYCHGLGCNACFSVGMMTKFQYGNVPKDMKGAK